MIQSDAELIRLHEGCRLSAYRDTRGIWTIGIGHTGPEVHDGQTITQAEADALFQKDLAAARLHAQLVVGTAYWKDLAPPRQAVLTDMAFQLGSRGLHAFAHLLAAVHAKDWPLAMAEIIRSKLDKQTPERTEMNAAMMATGEWPGTESA